MKAIFKCEAPTLKNSFRAVEVCGKYNPSEIFLKYPSKTKKGFSLKKIDIAKVSFQKEAKDELIFALNKFNDAFNVDGNPREVESVRTSINTLMNTINLS